MSIRNAASVDNSIGSRAIYVAPDNRGEITCCDNRGHTRSRIDPNATYPSPIEASILLLFSSGLSVNLFEHSSCSPVFLNVQLISRARFINGPA